uniref:MADS-box 16 n=1 Tax=Momordica dioica TaxID=654836 RepID=A0A346NTP5_9ROSI|nr:MADS-box 16 [Momordica dioica]
MKKTSGRRKVEIKKMKKESRLQVTFSKRRVGLFKKAAELCLLCGAKIAIIVFSPGGKAFSFGHPDVDVELDRFRNRVEEHNNMNLDETEAYLPLPEMNRDLTEVKEEVEMEQKKKQSRKKEERSNANAEEWWEEAVEELNLSQLKCMKESLEDLKKKVAEKAEKLIHVTNPNFYVTSSNNAAPITGSGGNISTNAASFDQNRMTTPPQTLLFGFDGIRGF